MTLKYKLLFFKTPLSFRIFEKVTEPRSVWLRCVKICDWQWTRWCHALWTHL